MSGIGRACLGLCVGWLVCLGAQAEEDGGSWSGDRFTLSGFGTLGLARTDQRGAEYVRDLSQPYGLTRDWTSRVDSLIGVQANFKFSPRTEGVVQLMSRYRYDGSHRPEVSWAFLRHDFTPEFQGRLGRLGTEFYMQGDSRLVGYSNTTVRPPPDFYGPLIFNYFDGFDLSAGMELGGGLLRGKFFAGRSPETTPFYRDITWDLSGTRLLGGYLDYFLGPWQLRGARTFIKFTDRELPLNQLGDIALDDLGLGFLKPSNLTTQFPELSSANTLARFDSLGLIYDEGPLRVLSMVGRMRFETEAYEDSRAAFIIGSYRVGQFTPYLGYSATRSNASRITTASLVPGLATLAAQVTRGTHTDRHTLTLGSRWDFQENWALKVQFDAVRGRRDSMFILRGDNQQWDGRMNVFSLALDFAF